MKIIFTRIFVGLGVIFLILILAGVCFYIIDPYNLKPLIFGSDPVMTPPQKTINTTIPSITTETSSNTPENTAPTTQVSGGFVLSPAQKQALISFDIDPASVPSSISTEQETCFTGVLGASRVTEIKAGAVPSALEFFKAKACI